MITDEALSTRVRRFRFVLAVLLIISSSTLASVKGKPTQLSGYKAVRVHYGPLNKMIMSARINGQRANLLVDTGSNQVILNAAAAASFGINPSQGSLRYIRFIQINGQELPVGFAQNLTAGGMRFGSTLVTVRESRHSDTGGTPVDGVLGLDVLTRHKAVISAGQINDLKIGNFKMPPAKFGVTALPNFTLRQGSARVSGILGMDTLYDRYAIIDLDGMNLFLK